MELDYPEGPQTEGDFISVSVVIVNNISLAREFEVNLIFTAGDIINLCNTVYGAVGLCSY